MPGRDALTNQSAVLGASFNKVLNLNLNFAFVFCKAEECFHDLPSQDNMQACVSTQVSTPMGEQPPLRERILWAPQKKRPHRSRIRPTSKVPFDESAIQAHAKCRKRLVFQNAETNTEPDESLCVGKIPRISDDEEETVQSEFTTKGTIHHTPNCKVTTEPTGLSLLPRCSKLTGRPAERPPRQETYSRRRLSLSNFR